MQIYGLFHHFQSKAYKKQQWYNHLQDVIQLEVDYQNQKPHSKGIAENILSPAITHLKFSILSHFHDNKFHIVLPELTKEEIFHWFYLTQEEDANWLGR